jgi:hypothetical protein
MILYERSSLKHDPLRTILAKAWYCILGRILDSTLIFTLILCQSIGVPQFLRLQDMSLPCCIC